MTYNLFKQTLFLLKKYNITPKKKLSQHFLIDSFFLDKILEYTNALPTETILEIGAGLGTITKQIAKVAKKVIAIEIDPKLISLLNAEIKSKNVEIINANILDWDINTFVDKIVSNAPYNISSQLILKLATMNFKKAILVFQKDFVDKLLASAGSSKYGFISAVSNLLFFIETLDVIPPSAYFPKPKVFSVITIIEKNKKLEANEEEIKALIRFLRLIFNRKHKKLYSILKDLVKKSKISEEVMRVIPSDLLSKRPYNLTKVDLRYLYNLIGRAFYYETVS